MRIRFGIPNRFMTLTKSGLLPLICLLFSVNSFSQEESSEVATGDIYFGFKGGATFNRFYGSQPHKGITAGLTAGGFIGYTFNADRKMAPAVQLECSYIQKGGSLINFHSSNNVNPNDWSLWAFKAVNENIILHNLEVPLLLKLNYRISGGRLTWVVGPSISYNFKAMSDREVSAMPDYNNLNEVVTFSDKENISDRINDIHYSVVSGIGFELPVSEKNFVVFDARYIYGLTSTYDVYSYVNNPMNNADMKVHTMSFTVGFGF